MNMQIKYLKLKKESDSMIIDSKYRKYLIKTDSGYKIKENTPQNIIKKINEINNSYYKIYDEKLIET